MNEKPTWTLEEIRKAYADALTGWNALFPLHPESRREGDDVERWGDFEEEDFCADVFRKKGMRALSRLRKAAAQSCNAQIWHAGESLNNLSQGMRERIEKALRFGI
jgi:hypothetical protein